MAITRIAPQLRTTDLDASIAFYTAIPGFELDFRFEDFYAGIRAGDQVFHLKLVDALDTSIAEVADGDHLHLHIGCDNLDELITFFRDLGTPLVHEPATRPWGPREFAVRDNVGHTLYFSEEPGNG